VEGLEDRVTPATLNLPLAVQNLSVVGQGADRALQAVVSLAGQATDTVAISDVTLQKLADDPTTPAEECSVLSLHLAPINLQLLGLHVDTSQICLDVTATEGGGVLGDLLCGLADGGAVDLGGILGGLTGQQLGTLLGQLDNLLDGVLGQQLTVDQIFGDHGADGESVCTGECEILDLSLGPVDLSLLGLNVSLDTATAAPCRSASAPRPAKGCSATCCAAWRTAP